MTEPADENGDQHLVDVYAIRRNCGHHGATQATFAAAIGVPVKTLRNWEQGRRRPTGPAVVLLTVLWRNPTAVFEAIKAEPPAA